MLSGSIGFQTLGLAWKWENCVQLKWPSDLRVGYTEWDQNDNQVIKPSSLSWNTSSSSMQRDYRLVLSCKEVFSHLLLRLVTLQNLQYEGKHKHCLPQNWMLGVLKVHLVTDLLRPHQTVRVFTDSTYLEGHFQLHFHFCMRSFPVTLSWYIPLLLSDTMVKPTWITWNDCFFFMCFSCCSFDTISRAYSLMIVPNHFLYFH